MIQEIIKPHGPRSSATRSEQWCRQCRLRSYRGHRRSAAPSRNLCHHLPTASGGYKRSTPPRRATLSSSAACCCHCTTALAIIEPPWTATPVPLLTSWHRPELRTDAGSSLDLLTGALDYSSAPPPSLPASWLVPPWNLPHRWSSPLFGDQSSSPPWRLALRPLHRRPPAGRIFTSKPPVPTREKASPGAAWGWKTELE
jgi:hypothetical protein